MVNKTLKRILVISAVIGLVIIIFLIYIASLYRFIGCDLSCGDTRHMQTEQSIFNTAVAATCTVEEACTDPWMVGLPEGKLVVIIPKTITLGEQNEAVAFAYSPEIFSNNEIDELIQDFLFSMNLSEDTANIIKTDIVMDTRGYPYLRLSNDPFPLLFSYFYGTSDYIDYIDANTLTIWPGMKIIGTGWSEGSNDFWIEFYYSERICGDFCEYPHIEVNLFLQS